MKIAIIDTLGLAYDGSTLTKRGLGGSESAVILMARELVKLNFNVEVYNDCSSDDCKPGIYDGVQYRRLSDLDFVDSSYDIVIATRSVAAFAPEDIRHRFKSFIPLPDFSKIMRNAKKKILWMHDTFCDGDDLIEDYVLEGRIDEIFTLSDFHTDYVTNCMHGKRRNFEVLKKYVWQTRNGIQKHFEWTDIKDKDPDLFVFNSSVTKGLIPLVERIWPRVKTLIPQAKLKVIGGYYRFRNGAEPDEQEKTWRALVEKHPEVEFTGIIKQDEIARIMQQASYMIYPAAFPETFGISSLESLYYNTPLITNVFGALEETAVSNACYKIPYAIEPNVLFQHINGPDQENKFVKMVVEAYHNKYLHQQKMYACNQVKDICGWDTVALQWKQHFYNILGEYLPVEEYRKVQKINHRVKQVFRRRFSNPEELMEPRNDQNRIVCVVPFYNAEKYIAKCIESIGSQDYDNYIVHLRNDCSTDNSAEAVNQALNRLPREISKKFISWYEAKNKGAVYNQVQAMYYENEPIYDGDIIALIDGDDWLPNDPNIFHKINNAYREGAQFTYGSCWSVIDNIPLIAQPYPPEVKQNRRYRDYRFNWNMPYTHLRTFDAMLITDMVPEDFMLDGQWPRAGGDTHVFYTLIEKADPDGVVCIPDILYCYNDANPLNDYKINGEEQTKTAQTVLNKKDDMNKKKILIAIPTARNIEVDTFKSIYDLEVPDGYETDFQYFYGYQIDQVRNLIADWVVNKYDYLFAVDSDISFPRDTLKKLLEHNASVVSGIYRQRLPDQHIEVFDKGGWRMGLDEIIDKGLVEVGGVGFGCVLVKKQVFVDIGYPQFEYKSALRHEDTVSEDWIFCQKARDKGYKIYVDSTIHCGHHGSTVFRLETPKEVPTFDAPEENKTLQRFRELGAQRLLPEKHSEYLKTIRDQYGLDPKVIYDIGACVLHWTTRAQEVWPNAQIIPFEAMGGVADYYAERGFDQYWLGILTDQNFKQVKFYENEEHPGGNSYFKENPELSPGATALFPESSKKTRTGFTLDYATQNMPLPDLIKMDIQGAELDVLKGAEKCLAHAKHLILELQHKDYNHGAPKAEEVIQWLADRGWFCNGMFCGSVLGVDGDYHFTKMNL